MGKQVNWTTTGRHGGVYIEGAFRSLETVVSTATLVIGVLDAVSGDAQLSQSIELRTFFDDLKVGRLGQEWRLEGAAIASQQAADFREEWPKLRVHVLENQLVALCTATEQFVKVILTEFPSAILKADFPHSGDAASADNMIDRVDCLYRNRLKKLQSISATWALLCAESGVPSEIKQDVDSWANSPSANTVDSLALIRNQLIHAAGVVSPKLAVRIGAPSGSRIKLDLQDFRRYSHACSDFALRLYPVL